jgi:hypothetical protein
LMYYKFQLPLNILRNVSLFSCVKLDNWHTLASKFVANGAVQPVISSKAVSMASITHSSYP